MNKTPIEYLDYTWNPIAMRCTPVSEGCQKCWHLAMAKRQAANPVLSKKVRDAKAGGQPVLIKRELRGPLHVREPSRIGVQYMGDLFHDDVPSDFIDSVFAVMSLCPRQTFLVLTKRPARMAAYLNNPRREITVWFTAAPSGGYNGPRTWPLPNLWLGLSCETQERADERIPALLDCPAAVRFVSLEPLLGPIDLWPELPSVIYGSAGPRPPRIGQVIVGCESRGCRLGRLSVDGKATPADWWLWVRMIRDQCIAAGVPLFIKQGPSLDGKRLVKMPAIDGVVWDQYPRLYSDG